MEPDLLNRLAPAKIYEPEDRNEVFRRNEQLLAAELDAAGHLQHVATQLITSQDIDVLHGLILDTTLEILHSDIGSIQRFFPQRGANGELKLLSHRGFSAEASKRWEWVSAASRTTCGEALRTGRRIAITDVRTCDFMAGSEDLDGYLGEGIRAAHTMQLISRSGALLGMVSAYWREPREVSVTELRSLDVLARMAADAIERSRAEESLRESEERFRSMADTAPVMIWVSGPDMLPTFFNREWLAFTGRTMEEELAGGWAEGVHPDDLHRVRANCTSSVEARRSFQMEYRFRRADGEYRWVLCRGNPRISPDSTWAGYIGSVVDVTDVKRAQSEAFDKQRIESLRVLTNG